MLYTATTSAEIEPPAQSEAILEKSINTWFAQVCRDGVGNKVRDVILAGGDSAVDLTNCLKTCTNLYVVYKIQLPEYRYTIKVYT